MSKTTPPWLGLVISVAGRRGTVRMRVWRALKAVGAAVLRDGVYLLPASAEAQAVFDAQARAVRAVGGEAHVLTLITHDDQAFRQRFDRGAEYAVLLGRVEKLHAQLTRRRVANAPRLLITLKRDFAFLSSTDYFPGPAMAQAREALSELERLANASGADGEPQTSRTSIARRDPAKYRGRIWATRARPWVDRMASAWLIKRFIDPKAKILWLTNIKRCPKQALGFDFDGATFSHVGARVTFEHLLASFGLERDPALQRLGRLVHFLDVGGAPVPEAQGLSAILSGARERLTRDNQLLAEASRVFDHLYHSYQEK